MDQSQQSQSPSASATQSPKATRPARAAVNRGARQKTQKELKAERDRIDMYMEQIEAAKTKARAQRVEYGKFLQWKVNIQRRERKTREEEESAMRKRVNEKLSTLLKEHRQAQLEHRTKWRGFATNPAPKPHVLHIPSALERDLKVQEKLLEEQRLRALQRRTIIPQTAPQKSEQLTPTKPAATAEAAPTSARESGIDKTQLESLLKLPEIVCATTVSLTPGQQAEYSRLERTTNYCRKHLAQIGEMFDKARTRRLYATSRMLADPPADMVITADVLRYIPSDVISREPQGFGEQEGKKGPAFFMTAVDGTGKIPSEEHVDPHEKSKSGGLSRWHSTGRVARRYNEASWMKLGPTPPVKLVEERVPEEENATLEWYDRYHSVHFLQGLRKRTEHHGKNYNWKRLPRHVLPPLRSVRFDTT